MMGQLDLIKPQCVTGIGRHILSTSNGNQCMYEGQFSLDKREGFGRLFWNDGTYYLGEWKNDLRNGYGQLVHKSGKMEQGTWIDGKLAEVHDIASIPEATDESASYSAKAAKKK